MKGHWLIADFQYHERALKFKQLCGFHSRENMVELLNITLEKLQIESKLLTITADNTSNNETLISKLYFNLTEKFLTFETTSLETKQLHFCNSNLLVD